MDYLSTDCLWLWLEITVFEGAREVDITWLTAEEPFTPRLDPNRK
jgi:hypothetical protein